VLFSLGCISNRVHPLFKMHFNIFKNVKKIKKYPLYILTCYMLMNLFQQILTCFVPYVKKIDFGTKKIKMSVLCETLRAYIEHVLNVIFIYIFSIFLKYVL
jgi:hypothetical protein